jgi:hypothetical protein
VPAAIDSAATIRMLLVLRKDFIDAPCSRQDGRPSRTWRPLPLPDKT